MGPTHSASVFSVHSTLGKTAQDLHLLEAKSMPTLESQVRLESLVPPVQPTSHHRLSKAPKTELSLDSSSKLGGTLCALLSDEPYYPQG